MATMTAVEACPDCGREWPVKFGAHNCNFRRVQVHKDAIVIQPFADFPESVERLASRMRSETCRSAQYWDLAGGEGPHPYKQALNQIDYVIGQLKRARQEMQDLAGHKHRWDADDYCAVCGADGRA
jgi:hypothetical protein